MYLLLIAGLLYPSIEALLISFSTKRDKIVDSESAAGYNFPSKLRRYIMIRSRLNILLAEKGHREGRKLTYRVVSEETTLSQGVLVRLNSDNFGRLDTSTLDILCRYFGCGIGDILVFVPSASASEAGAAGSAF